MEGVVGVIAQCKGPKEMNIHLAELGSVDIDSTKRCGCRGEFVVLNGFVGVITVERSMVLVERLVRQGRKCTHENQRVLPVVGSLGSVDKGEFGKSRASNEKFKPFARKRL